jgi:four helix bundle protein
VLLAGQLYRSLGSIHANYSEGYSHSTGGNRARYFEYSLGSARESRGWYFDGRHVLGERVLDHRMSFLARVIQLLIVTVPDQRKSSLREVGVEYDVDDSTDGSMQVEDHMDDELSELLRNVPLP